MGVEVHKAKKPFKLYEHPHNKDGSEKQDETGNVIILEHTIPRGSIWRLSWCGGQKSFKELTGKIAWNRKRKKETTITLPDEYVTEYFAKI